jgi:hypothetical protein
MDCLGLAHDTRVAIKSLKGDDLRPYLRGEKRLLRDWAVAEWEFKSDDKSELRRARENFYVQGFGNTVNKMLQAVAEHPTTNVQDLCTMILADDELLLRPGEDGFCGLRRAVPFVRGVINILINDNCANTLASWQSAMQRVVDKEQIAFSFSSVIKVRV